VAAVPATLNETWMTGWRTEKFKVRVACEAFGPRKRIEQTRAPRATTSILARSPAVTREGAVTSLTLLTGGGLDATSSSRVLPGEVTTTTPRASRKPAHRQAATVLPRPNALRRRT